MQRLAAKKLDQPVLPSDVPAADVTRLLPADRFLGEPPVPTTLAAIAAPGIAAMRKLWLPFVLLQACGLAVVIGYFNVPAVHDFCDRVGQWKAAGGYAFSAVLLSIAGGLTPEVFKLITRADDRSPSQRLRDTAFNCAMYLWGGVQSDAFYRALAVLVGTRATVGTILAKVSIDQFLWTPLLGAGFISLAYTFREHRYRPIDTLRSLGVAWYISRVGTLLLPCWAYWVPMTCLMYALPTSLTFVFGAFATAAAATVLIAIAARKTTREDSRQ